MVSENNQLYLYYTQYTGIPFPKKLCESHLIFMQSLQKNGSKFYFSPIKIQKESQLLPSAFYAVYLLILHLQHRHIDHYSV